MAEETREMALEQSRLGREMALEYARGAADAAREQAQLALEQRAAAALMQADARAMAEQIRGQVATAVAPALANAAAALGDLGSAFATRPPSPWAQRDPADSLYRVAYETMNKGDYRKAAALFREIPQKFQYSAYAADAMYWAAHALYRVGTTPDLQDALQTLEQLKQKYPNSRLRGSQADVATLQVRIAGVLSARGQGGSDIVKRALAQGTNICDAEEQQIRSAALNALMQTDPDAASDYAQKVLGRKDDCSRDIRRTAVFLIGNRGDPKAAATLMGVARNDPAADVRSAAIQYLGRMPGDDALGLLEELARSDADAQVQREAIRQLARSANPKARGGIKALVERNDVSENLRITALDALDPERSTQEDVAWLQATYAKVESPRVRSRIISAMARIGGAQNEKWFATLANNENESIDVRVEALRRAAPAMDVAALGRLYDQTGQRQLRSELIRQLGNRREPEAIDKLGEIVKTGTDPQLRTRAIEVLSNSKDPRAAKLLLSLIDRP
jgi:HEAT repeat protein